MILEELIVGGSGNLSLCAFLTAPLTGPPYGASIRGDSPARVSPTRLWASSTVGRWFGRNGMLPVPAASTWSKQRAGAHSLTSIVAGSTSAGGCPYSSRGIAIGQQGTRQPEGRYPQPRRKGGKRQAGQPALADGSELKRIIIDIVGESLDGDQLGAIVMSRCNWDEAV